jgi:hypothetical protein
MTWMSAIVVKTIESLERRVIAWDQGGTKGPRCKLRASPLDPASPDRLRPPRLLLTM